MSILNDKKENRGGYRANAKRPNKYKEDAVIYIKLIPKSQLEKISELVDKICKPYLNKKA